MRIAAWLAAVYLGAVAVALVVGATGSVESGPLAVVVLASAHLALAGLVFVPVLAAGRSRGLGLALAAVALLFGLRFGGEWVSLPPTPATGATILVATWNLDAFQRTGPDAVDFLRDHPADLVALEELTPPVAAAIAADPDLASMYPHQSLDASAGTTGIGLLSRHPLDDPEYGSWPARLETRIATPTGTIGVVAAHPFPARFLFRNGIPIGYDPTQRNADLGLLRDRVGRLTATGNPALLIGDFNTAPTEAAFARFTAGLHDAHAEVGEGPGWTWRPEPLDFIGIGLLRIDLILSSDGLRPTTTSIDCPTDGDHCLFEARLVVEPG